MQLWAGLWSLSMYIVHSASGPLCGLSVAIILWLFMVWEISLPYSWVSIVTGLFLPIQVRFTPFSIQPFLQRYESPSDSMKRKVNDHIFHWLFHRFSGIPYGGLSSRYLAPGQGLAESECSVFGPASKGRVLVVNISELETEQTFQGWGGRKNIWVILPKALMTFLVGSLISFSYCFLPIDGLIWGLKNGEKLHQ